MTKKAVFSDFSLKKYCQFPNVCWEIDKESTKLLVGEEGKIKKIKKKGLLFQLFRTYFFVNIPTFVEK
jgi:hypothetical protein